MYTRINTNAEKLAESFDRRSLENYLKLQPTKKFYPTKDDEYKKLYKYFYGMNRAGLGNDFYSLYFNILETKKVNDEPLSLKNDDLLQNLDKILNCLAKTPSNKTGTKKVQFSFATKLLHTLNENAPIYDRHIKCFYCLEEITGKSIADRIEKCLKHYTLLIHEYEQIKSGNLLKPAIDAFSQKIEGFGAISLTKQIDYILWHFKKTYSIDWK